MRAVISSYERGEEDERDIHVRIESQQALVLLMSGRGGAAKALIERIRYSTAVLARNSLRIRRGSSDLTLHRDEALSA